MKINESKAEILVYNKQPLNSNVIIVNWKLETVKTDY